STAEPNRLRLAPLYLGTLKRVPNLPRWARSSKLDLPHTDHLRKDLTVSTSPHLPTSKPAQAHSHDHDQPPAPAPVTRPAPAPVAQKVPTGAEKLIRCLEREGVEYVFGLSGGAAMPIFDALVDSKIKLILV